MVIPKSISKRLLPNPDVVDAVRRSTFHIWPITLIDEAITLFADMDAGNLQDDGRYPTDNFHPRAIERLEELGEINIKKKWMRLEKAKVQQPPLLLGAN